MAKKEEKAFFTEYGTVSYFGKDYFLSDFLKEYRIEEISYDEENHCFDITVAYYEDIWVDFADEIFEVYKTIKLYLSDEQKEQMENGIMDNDIQTLMGIIKKQKKALILKSKEALNREITETGKYPTNLEELLLYAEYLQEQLKETKANITKNIRKASLPVFIGSITIGSFVSAAITQDNTTYSTLFPLIVIGGTLFTGIIYSRNWHDSIEDIKADYKEYKMLYYKLLKLQLKFEQLGLLKKGQSIKSLPSVEDEYDVTYVYSNNNDFDPEEFFSGPLSKKESALDTCNEEIPLERRKISV